MLLVEPKVQPVAKSCCGKLGQLSTALGAEIGFSDRVSMSTARARRGLACRLLSRSLLLVIAKTATRRMRLDVGKASTRN